jgi:hypothetical protein
MFALHMNWEQMRIPASQRIEVHWKPDNARRQVGDPVRLYYRLLYFAMPGCCALAAARTPPGFISRG